LRLSSQSAPVLAGQDALLPSITPAKWKEAAGASPVGLLLPFSLRPEPSSFEPADLANASPAPRWPTQASPPLKGRPKASQSDSTNFHRISTLTLRSATLSRHFSRRRGQERARLNARTAASKCSGGSLWPILP